MLLNNITVENLMKLEGIESQEWRDNVQTLEAIIACLFVHESLVKTQQSMTERFYVLYLCANPFSDLADY